jgi:hypothetical protein
VLPAVVAALARLRGPLGRAGLEFLGRVLRHERATSCRLAYSSGGMARSARITSPGAPAACAALISSSLPAGKSTSRRACRS